MAYAVSIQQAACNALQLWLGSQLSIGLSGVEQRWPDPEKALPTAGAVTILLAGGADVVLVDPAVTSITPVDETHKTFLVRHQCRRQPLELDAWHIYDVGLDDLCEQLDVALNAPENLTMPGVWNADLTRNGVLLPLGDGFTGNCDFTFEQPDRHVTADRAQQNEWRATYRGFVDVMLARTVTSIVMTQLQLRQKAHESVKAPLAGTDIAQLDKSVHSPNYIFDRNS